MDNNSTIKIFNRPSIPIKPDAIDLSEKSKSSVSEVWRSNIGIYYGSTATEAKTSMRLGFDPNENPNDAWSASNSDNPKVIEILNNPNLIHLKPSLVQSRDEQHFFEIVGGAEQRIKQRSTVENSSVGTWLLAVALDPINIATVFVPILKSKSIYGAIVRSASTTGATIAPLETARTINDPLVEPTEAVVTTGSAMLFSSVFAGLGKGISNGVKAKMAKSIIEDMKHMSSHANEFADAPVWRTIEGEIRGRIGAKTITDSTGEKVTQYSVVRGGKRVDIDFESIPIIKNPNSIDTSGGGAFINSWLFKGITTPEKRTLLNEKINDNVKEMFNNLGSSHAFKLNKNNLGIASDFSVNIKANTDHGLWVKVHDDLIGLYSKDMPSKKFVSVLDYNVSGRKPLDAWMTNINRRLVQKDFNGATDLELEGIRILEKFWKDWEERLISVNMIGTTKGMKLEIQRLTNHIADLKKRGPTKGDINFNKKKIKEYETEIKNLQDDIDNNIGVSSMPSNETSFFARYYNHDEIRARREEFTQIIAKYYSDNPFIYERGKKVLLPYDDASVNKRAQDTVAKILNETEGNFDVSYSGTSSKHTRHRNLDIPNKLVWDFIEQNPINVMKSYTARVAPEYHFKNTFKGRSIDEVLDIVYNDVVKSAGKKTAQATVRDFTHMYERVVTSVTHDPTKLNQKIRAVLNDLTGLTYLGSAGFATLTDYAAIVMQRETGAFFKAGFSILDGQKLSLNALEGRYAGQAIDILQQLESMRLIDDMSSRGIDRGMYNKVSGKVKKGFYALNLLGPATALAKRLESILRAHQIVEDAILIHSGKATKKTKAMMAKMGLGQNEITEIATKAPWERNADKGLYLANSGKWVEAGVSLQTVDKFKNSMHAGIFNTVIMASPSDKPIAMDGVMYVPWKIAKFVPGFKEDKRVRGYSRIENGLMSLPFAFMSYSFGAANKITASLAQDTLKSKAIGITAAMGLAYMGLQFRYRNRPWVLENMSNQDKFMRVFDYSGLASMYSDLFYRGLSTSVNLGYENRTGIKPKFISRDEEERPFDAALEVLGAPASLVTEYGRGMNDFINGRNSEGTERFARNLPFMKIWFLENEMRELNKVIGRW